MILDKIVQQRKLQLQQEKKRISLAELQIMAQQSLRKPLDLAKFLVTRDFSIIAELKKASPFKGVLVQDFQPQNLAQQYQSLGAQGISCLTEEYYFQGSYYCKDKINYKISNYNELNKIEIPKEV